MATKVHAAPQIQSRPQTANGTLQKYIQRLTNLIIHTTDANPISVTCKVTIILFIRHLNKDIKKQVAGTKNIQTLRHGMILAQTGEIKFKSKMI